MYEYLYNTYQLLVVYISVDLIEWRTYIVLQYFPNSNVIVQSELRTKCEQR